MIPDIKLDQKQSTRGHRIYIIYIVLKYMYIASKWTCEKDNYYSKKKTELVSC